MELPAGTVTFLFTDIEGSTRLLDELGDGYADVLAEHHRAMRAAFTPHGGVEVDTAGDAFFVAFARASDAVAAAADAQAKLAAGPVRVRMGIHTGEPLVTETGYVGMDVHRAARVMSAGHGGQVLVSQTTRQFLDDGFELRDLGEHRLKDLSAPQRLYQLGDSDFPPLKTLYRTNLPVQPTPLVGRERELADAGDLLRSNRLLTLLGPGGSGKTRLALQLAAEAAQGFPDGVFWVSLQGVEDPALVPATIAHAVGVQGDLGAALASKRMLLLLDNLEHLLDAAGSIGDLLAAAPGVNVVATSRAPLRLSTEQRYLLEPLPAEDAATLFLERARAADPAFQASPAVASICARLDGLPLAIELAAARISLLGADALLERLDRALPLLTGGSRDAPERQRTLSATIQWSYELLGEEERRLFGALSIFTGSFDLEAATVVCAAELDTLQSLVEKSLVRRWGSGRFGMLETIHEFARERLRADEALRLGRRHAEHYLEVARGGNFSAEATSAEETELGRHELANFRGALRFCVDESEPELGLQIATALERLWTSIDPFEGARWFEALLSPSATIETSILAAALRAYGGTKYIVGDFEAGVGAYQRSLELFRGLGDAWGEAHLLHRLAVDAVRVGDVERARTLSDQGLAFSVRAGDTRGIALAKGTLAQAAVLEGDTARAVELYTESAQAAAEAGFTWWQGIMDLDLAELLEDSGQHGEADEALRRGAAAISEVGDRQNVVFALALAARFSGRDGRLADAGLFWGAVEAEEQRGRIGQWEEQAPRYAEAVAAYAGPEFERGRSEGRTLALTGAVRKLISSE